MVESSCRPSGEGTGINLLCLCWGRDAGGDVRGLDRDGGALELKGKAIRETGTQVAAAFPGSGVTRLVDAALDPVDCTSEDILNQKKAWYRMVMKPCC